MQRCLHAGMAALNLQISAEVVELPRYVQKMLIYIIVKYQLAITKHLESSVFANRENIFGFDKHCWARFTTTGTFEMLRV